MPRKSIGAISIAAVYPAYLAKVERKGRDKADLDTVIAWLTGYDQAGLTAAIARDEDFTSFFAAAPALNPNRALITGMICGHRVEAIADPVEQQVRQLDKLVDELAKGRPLAKVLRADPAA